MILTFLDSKKKLLLTLVIYYLQKSDALNELKIKKKFYIFILLFLEKRAERF